MKTCEDLNVINGTSFHGHTITTTVNKLKEICGDPYYGSTEDKVQHEWCMQTDDGTPFTIYDWKEYRHYDDNDLIEFHIGGHQGLDAIKGLEELRIKLNK